MWKLHSLTIRHAVALGALVLLASAAAFGQGPHGTAPEAPSATGDDAVGVTLKDVVALAGAKSTPQNQLSHSDETYTGWSGMTGIGKVHRIGPEKCSKQHPSVPCTISLRGIGIGEAQDKPCYAHGYRESLNSRYNDDKGLCWNHSPCQAPYCTTYTVDGQSYRFCPPAVGVGSGLQSVSFTGRHYVHAVQVCLNGDTKGGDQYRVKGMKVWSVTVDANTGAVGAENGMPGKFELPNCKEWKAKRSCGAGQVASAFKVSTDPTDTYVTGIELECARVERR